MLPLYGMHGDKANNTRTAKQKKGDPAIRQYPNYLRAPQHFLYFWPLPHEQGAFGLSFFLPVGLVNAGRGSLRMTSSTRRRASAASASP